MSGHSKWKNIAHRKEKTDAQRAKVFTKLSREIIVAVREGGADISANPRLKDVIAKARVSNVPTENIKRVIERAAGSASGDNYESNRYEGYGPGGVAVIVETMTDNRNRTASEMRHAFDKNGGKLGPSGCVSWSFDSRGVIVIERAGRDEDETMLDALECGAADFATEEEVFQVYTAPEDFGAVHDELERKGYTFLSAQVEMVPQTTVAITDDDQLKYMQRLLDTLEDNDDVQNVWHNSGW